MITRLRIWLGLLAAVTVIGCAASAAPPEPIDLPPMDVLDWPRPTTPTPTATPEARQLATSSVPSVPGGEALLAERIAGSDIVARVEIVSVQQAVESSRTFDVTSNRYLPAMFGKALEYTFTVHEYLKGSGGSRVVGLALDKAERYPTRVEAEASSTDHLSARDTQWEDREAIVFMAELSPRQTNRYFFGIIRTRYGEVDMYTLASRYAKKWLPSTTEPSDGDSTGQQQTDEREYLLDVPGTSGGSQSSRTPQSTPPTMSLTALKAEVAMIEAEIAAGDGTDAYKYCVYEKYKNQRVSDARLASYIASGQPMEARLFALGSGLAEGTRVNQRGISYYSLTRGAIEGADSDLFEVNPVGVVRTLRPLPAGEYRFTYLERRPELDPCDAPIPESAKNFRQYAVDVTAPAGSLHEAFFDPVTVGTAVKADVTNGVLRPATFTDANHASATVQSISYEPPTSGSVHGTVKLQVDPHTGLGGHRLELIELDGSVSLWLEIDEATVDAPNKTLSWSVTSQPWEDGDKLMLRIEEAELGIALFGVPSTITHGQIETFTVRASGLSATSSYSVLLTTDNGHLGFAGTCSIPEQRKETSGSSSSSFEINIQGCTVGSGTLTVTFQKGSMTIGTAEAEVEVEVSTSVRLRLSAREERYATYTDISIEWTDPDSCEGRYLVGLFRSSEMMYRNFGFHPAPSTTTLEVETGLSWAWVPGFDGFVRVSCHPTTGPGWTVGQATLQSGLPSTPSSQ